VTFGNQVYVDSTTCVADPSQELVFVTVGSCSTKPCDGNAQPQSIFQYTNSTTMSEEALLVFGSSLNHTLWQVCVCVCVRVCVCARARARVPSRISLEIAFTHMSL
jgi:hypothetical protein